MATGNYPTGNFVESLFDFPCELYYWHIAEKGWRGGKNGTMHIVPYDNHYQTKLVFMPSDADAFTGILSAKIHPALSVGRYHDDTQSILFGKATSRAYTNSKGKAIKTTWKVSFEPHWSANNFVFILNRLVEHGGNFGSFNQEDNCNLVPLDGVEEQESTEDEVEEQVSTDEDDDYY
jgi:hypothetical protein